MCLKTGSFARRHVDQKHVEPEKVLKLGIGPAGQPPGKDYSCTGSFVALIQPTRIRQISNSSSLTIEQYYYRIL